MKVKLYSAADLLRQNSPRKFASASNRFSFLRDESPAPGSDSGRRFRSPSVKRKPDDNLSYSFVAGKNLSHGTPPQDNSQALELVSINAAKVTSLCEKVKTELSTLGAEPEICTIFNDLCEAIRCINDSQRHLADSKYSFSQPSSNPAPPKKVKQSSTTGIPAPASNSSTQPHSEVTEPEEDAERRNFREAVKEAEKSTLIFNLDMGKVPIMNKETISKKATLALASMAAKLEGKSTVTPSDDAVTAIDDVLSMTTGMSLFGNATKSYKNAKDSNSGAYCTIPVKYSFKDKDTRIRAETALRSRCKVSCATPYPIILRECMRQVVDIVRKKYPGEFVRCTVDSTRLTLSVARRGNGDTVWSYLRDEIFLPIDVLNVDAKKVPDGFVIRNLPDSLCDFTPTKHDRGRQRKKSSHMEVAPPNE